MKYLNSKQLLNKRQYGFTPQTGTTEALMDVKEFVEDSLTKNGVVVMISLDVKGAFNAAWWPALFQSMRNMQCPRNLYNLTIDYFSGRMAALEMNGVRVERAVNRGCPQGSCCGPGYWNIQYNSLLNLGFTKSSRAIAYADDFLLLVRGKQLLEVENIANIELQKISSWSRNNKIQFHEKKSKIMIISKRRAIHKEKISIYLNYKQLEQVCDIKYLGVHIDHKFKFYNHVKYITDRCCKLINILARSARISWGLRQDALNAIYKGAIIPIMTYAAPVWSTALQKQFNRQKVNRVHRLINIRILKAFRTLSYDASCVLSGHIPLVIKIDEISAVYNKLKEKNLENGNTRTMQGTEAQRVLRKQQMRAVGQEMRRISEERWQVEWTNGRKGEHTRAFFPIVALRLKTKLPFCPKITTILSGHGPIGSYYYRFNITDSPNCACAMGVQDVNHIIYECPLLVDLRLQLRTGIEGAGKTWPVAGASLVEHYNSEFVKFIRSIDFDILRP